uniref:Uncharacterized protein MANES_04G135600 n=1 Tax=Rhizophora mucronata TaxID=61149 RepID=A0A2P2M5S1_RHIMU
MGTDHDSSTIEGQKLFLDILLIPTPHCLKYFAIPLWLF